MLNQIRTGRLKFQNLYGDEMKIQNLTISPKHSDLYLLSQKIKGKYQRFGWRQNSMLHNGKINNK